MSVASLVIEQSRNPYWNLAVEDALLESVCRGLRRLVFRLWVNDRSIIIGRGLDACSEVRCGAARGLGIPIVRRSSGGGAVYHDHGNLNISIIEATRGRVGVDRVYSTGTGFITSVLRRLGLTMWSSRAPLRGLGSTML